MKKFICSITLITLLLLFYSPCVKAQNTGGSGNQIESGFGVTGGLNVAKIIGEDLDYETRLGVMLGFYYRMMLMNGPLGLQPELLFNQMGATYNDNDFKLLLNYISLNALLIYVIQTSGNIRPIVGIGPYFSYLMAAKNKFEDESIDIKDEMNSTDIGLALKAGILINRLEFGLRMMYGFTGVFADNEEDFRVRNFVIGFYIAYTLSGR